VALRNGGRLLGCVTDAFGSVTVAACGGVPPPAAPRPPADVIVLAVDPETGVLGRAVVEAQGQSVTLASDLSATRVTPGQVPAAPTTMAAGEFQQRFA